MEEISIFGMKTSRRLHKIKNNSIWISIYKEIKEQNQERKIDHEERDNHKTL